MYIYKIVERLLGLSFLYIYIYIYIYYHIFDGFKPYKVVRTLGRDITILIAF